jgi:hypothetical protein
MVTGLSEARVLRVVWVSYRIAPGDLAARITYPDHARALIDEAEQPEARCAHIGVRAR